MKSKQPKNDSNNKTVAQPPSKSVSRRTFLGYAGVTALAAATATGVTVKQSYRFDVNTYTHALKGLTAPLKVAQLSDLHYGQYIQKNMVEQWVDATLQTQPDLIVITGDFVDFTTRGSLEPLIQSLSRLSAPLGVYGVLGNHDYDRTGKRLENLRLGLAEARVQILMNEGVMVREDLFLCGVDDLINGQPDLSAALRDVPDDGAVMLLSHVPDILPEVPERVTLTLSGHTHGGQIKLPGYGPLRTASVYGTRYLEGWKNDPVPAFISRGLGFSLLPVRVDSKSEVVVFEFYPA